MPLDDVGDASVGQSSCLYAPALGDRPEYGPIGDSGDPAGSSDRCNTSIKSFGRGCKSQSLALGCGTDYSSNWGNYAWLETASYAPRFTPYRSGNIRVHHAVQMDMSLLKSTKINERMRFQFGFEAFNILNHNYYGRDNINTDPNSANFGGVIPANVSTQNILPRQIQVRLKFFW